MAMKRFAVGFVLTLSLLQVSCVTEVEKPLAQTNLFTTRSGDQIRISWVSRPGEQYSVWYSDTLGKGAQWKVLPGAERVSGTGDQIERTDQVPGGGQRYYRIVTKPAQ